MNTKQFITELNKVGYTTNVNHPAYIVKIDGAEDEEYSFDFDVANTNFCCGMYEIGDVSISGKSNFNVVFSSRKKEDKNLIRALVLLISFQILNDIGINKKGKTPQSYQYIFTGNGLPVSKLVGMGLLHTGRFKEVCKSINPGSKRELTTYIGV